MQKTLLAAAIMALASVSVSAQQVDPYADVYQQQQQFRRDKLKAIFVDKAFRIYFATRCHVINMRQVWVLPQTLSVAQEKDNEAYLVDMMGRATERLLGFQLTAKEYYDLMKQGRDIDLKLQSKCDYWRQDPEALVAMREFVKRAYLIMAP